MSGSGWRANERASFVSVGGHGGDAMKIMDKRLFTAVMGQGGFSPLHINSLALWLKADELIYQDDAQTTPAVSDDDVIGAWGDKSSGNNDVVQATTSNKSTLKLDITNGKSFIRYDGLNDYLDAAKKILSSSTPTFTVFVAFRIHRSIDSIRLTLLGQKLPNVICFGDGGKVRLELQYASSAQTNVARGSTDIQQEFIVATLMHGASEDRIRINGVEESISYRTGSFTAGLDDSDDNLSIGRQNAGFGRYFLGDERQILICTNELSDSEISKMEQYLANDIALSLDGAAAPSALLGYSAGVGLAPHAIRLFGGSKQYALTADLLDNKIRSLNVSNPSSISVLKTITSFVGPFYVVINAAETYAYVCQSAVTPSFKVIDISDPANMAVVASIDDADFGGGQEIVLHGNYAYVGSSYVDKVVVVDVSNPLAPSKITTIGGAGAPNYLNFPAHLEIDAVNNILYVAASHDHRISAFDISTPASISFISSVQSGIDDPHELWLDGDYLYVACMDIDDHAEGGLIVIDVSNPAIMIIVKTLRISDDPSNNYFDWLHGLWLSGDYLYAVASHPDMDKSIYTHDSAINIFDVSTPTNPTLVYSYRSVPYLSGAHNLEVYNGKIYVAVDDGQKIVVWDDPTV